MTTLTLNDEMLDLGKRARAAARVLSQLSAEEKNRCLLAMADALTERREEIKAANRLDLETAAEMGLSAAMVDRLKLDDKRIAGMASGVAEVANLPDPVGCLLEERVRPNGLILQKITAPLGVIVIIYESRPNVTADAASLCFKSGNATILRGGKEAIHSNRIIGETLVQAGASALPKFPADAIQVVRTTDRAAVPALLSLTEYVDLCMPRGGESLIRAVADCSKVPVIKHYKGVCHVYVDADADPEMARAIAVNAKVQRPGVCNAMETLLIDRACAATLLPSIANDLLRHEVELRVDDEGREHLEDLQSPRVIPATEADWESEYLDLVLAVRVVDGLEGAIDHINRFGSGHSDTIVTSNEDRARHFLRAVDSAAVYWNASTRFTDGAEFGMGAEIGISTDKIGARGPMGLAELTTYKWIGLGTGQVRS